MRDLQFNEIKLLDVGPYAVSGRAGNQNLSEAKYSSAILYRPPVTYKALDHQETSKSNTSLVLEELTMELQQKSHLRQKKGK